MVTYTSFNKGAILDGCINEGFYAGESAANDGATADKIVDNSAHDTKLRCLLRYTNKPTLPIKVATLIDEALPGETRRCKSGMVLPYSEVKYDLNGFLESGWPIFLVMGTCVNAISGDYFTHTCTPNETFSLPSFTRWLETSNVRASQGESFKVIGNVINKMTLQAKGKELLWCGLEVLGKQIIQSTTDLLHADNKPSMANLGNGYHFGGCTLSVTESGDLTLLDASDDGHAYELQEFKLIYNNNAKTEQVANASNSTDTPSGVDAGGLECVLQVKLETNDRALLNWYNNYKNAGNVSVESDFTIKFTKSTNDYIEFVVRRARIKNIKEIGEEKVEFDVEFEGLENYSNVTAASRPSITCTIKDSIDQFNSQWYLYGGAAT